MTNDSARDPASIVHVPPGGGHSWWVFGDLDIIKAAGDETGGEMTFVETVVPAASGPPMHIHHNESESIYVLDGEVRVLANGKDLTLGAGGFVYLPKGSVHRFENTRDEPSRILLIFLPVGIEGYFRELGTPWVEGAPPPGEPVDFEKLAQVAPRYGIEIVDPPASPAETARG